jgi:hypothetical protein
MSSIYRSALRAVPLTLLTLACQASLAATYYVATTGSDSSGDGTSTKPWATIAFGIGKLASSDTLVVKAGTYTGPTNFINSRRTAIPNGTAAAFTTIMAEQPGTVRIKNTGTLDYYDNFIFLESTRYVKVDGFVLDHVDSQYPPYTVDVSGTFNKVTRTIVKRSGPTEQYGGWYYLGGSDNLLEDSAGVGSARYGFAVGGPSSFAQRIILRRCVGRMDYSISSQPKATFNVYGNDNGNFNVRDVLLQNTIALDGRKGPTTGDVTYGAYYFPKNPVNVTIQGSLSLNVESEYASFFIKELQGQNIKMVDTVAWAGYGQSSTAGLRANSTSGTTDYMVYDHLTVGAHGVAYYNKDSATTRQLTNSIFYGNSALSSGTDYGWTTASTNAFYPTSPTVGSAAIAAAAGDLKYIVRTEVGSKFSAKGTDGRDVGANMTVRYGRTGTLWGETGYDQRTTDNLWPWLLEDKIKSVFAETNPAPTGAVPSTNTTVRGFTVATDAFGMPMTLTRYVWQYLGNKIPDDVYGTAGAALPAPTGLSATVVTK